PPAQNGGRAIEHARRWMQRYHAPPQDPTILFVDRISRGQAAETQHDLLRVCEFAHIDGLRIRFSAKRAPGAQRSSAGQTPNLLGRAAQYVACLPDGHLARPVVAVAQFFGWWVVVTYGCLRCPKAFISHNQVKE